MKTYIVRTSGGGKNPMVGGIVITAIFGILTLVCAFSGDLDELFSLMILFALLAMGGVSLIVKGFQMKKRSKEPPIPIHEFDADAPDFVKERLNELMFEGKPTASSKTVKRVTVIGPDGVKRTTETVIENGEPMKSNRYHASNVTCESCGAVTKLRPGQSAVCEYCGTHIQG